VPLEKKEKNADATFSMKWKKRESFKNIFFWHKNGAKKC
jgi:hypothetical protein